VLRALQELAAQWKASIVAEGVETAPQLSVIRSLGIAAGQGYLLGRPASSMAEVAVDLSELEDSAEPDLAVLAMRARLATFAPDEGAA
jgi:EAL domain-containing protein (putative c-di-GMP-specific phosphodiesterase class I)